MADRLPPNIIWLRRLFIAQVIMIILLLVSMMPSHWKRSVGIPTEISMLEALALGFNSSTDIEDRRVTPENEDLHIAKRIREMYREEWQSERVDHWMRQVDDSDMAWIKVRVEMDEWDAEYPVPTTEEEIEFYLATNKAIEMGVGMAKEEPALIVDEPQPVESAEAWDARRSRHVRERRRYHRNNGHPSDTVDRLTSEDMATWGRSNPRP